MDSLIRAAARAPAVAPAGPAALRVGHVVGGNYRVEEVLGRGGMGVVYRATDMTLDRQVALKVMAVERWPEDARPRLLEIFRREARATAKLSHPAIVNLFHTGDDDGLLYLVLELLHGESLQERIERGPPDQPEALEIVEQILRGLAHAHARGILHRDLKPQNVFLGEDGRVRLLDFGLAALLERVGEPSERRAEVEILSKGGTPSYMAPEQWSGEPQDERTDLWAVGMILYRLLGVASIVPPSSVDALRDGLPLDGFDPAVAQLIRGATAFSPRDRFASATAMLEALEAVVRAAPPQRGVASRRRARRRVAVAVAALFVVGVAGVVVAWRLMAPGTPVSAEALPGAYHGQFDRLVLERKPDGSFWGAYAHDQGFLQARLVGERLVGWWCEAPTRTPPDDAGEMELHLRRGPQGELLLDGRYRYGRAGQWNDNWDFAATSAPMPDLVPRAGAPAPPCAPGK